MILDQFTKNATNALNDLKALLEVTVTPEILAKMTPEQKEEYNKALNIKIGTDAV